MTSDSCVVGICSLLHSSLNAPVMSNSDSPAPGLVDRVQSFVSENKRAILIGTAVAAVAVAYYASSSRPGRSPKKDKKKNKKRKTDQDVGGPILEERAPKVPDTDDPGELWPIPSTSSQCST